MWQQIRLGRDQGIVGIEEKPELFLSDQPLIITLAGLGQAMSEKNYMFSNLRKQLAFYGQWVAQFDYRGHGDSYGELGQTSISSMVSDSLEVLSFLTRDRSPSKVYLVGHALGAVIAQKVSFMWEKNTGIKCIPILISPPLKKLPLSKHLFSNSVLALLKEHTYIDSQLLIPGYDYYTLSDFDQAQYEYVIRLGAHLLYLHGQCLSKKMLEELDALEPMDLFNQNSREGYIICGEYDSETIELARQIDMMTLKVLPQVTYFHQHPGAMDQLIDMLSPLLMNEDD